jgi:hypothetical protein
MEEGYAQVDNVRFLEYWVSSLPKRNWAGILNFRGRRLPITAYRCVNCGYLEFYATEDRKEKSKGE